MLESEALNVPKPICFSCKLLSLRKKVVVMLSFAPLDGKGNFTVFNCPTSE